VSRIQRHAVPETTSGSSHGTSSSDAAANRPAGSAVEEHREREAGGELEDQRNRR